MRIVQLIDSLETGGAERMAVSYANAIGEKEPFSGLVVTRKEGPLKNQISDEVGYLFLEKKGVFDRKAFMKLYRFIKEYKIEIIHAHSSSFFLASLLKLILPNLRLIWHDHYGNSEFLHYRKATVLQICSFLFSGIIVVNEQLRSWSEKKLYCKKVSYLPNFVAFVANDEQLTQLKGKEGKRIVCLANLRPQKNHPLLLEVASLLKKSHPDWSFHLVGKDFGDDYSREVKEAIEKRELQNHVFIYDSRTDISNILKQSAIGVLTSKSEGLPVALLEYGIHHLPVVVTAVGEIPELIKDGVNGLLVASADYEMFYEKITGLIESQELQYSLREALFITIRDNFTKEAVIEQYLRFLKA
jgi:glycosyltransferase involved in cell wall biosynthesis